VFFLIPNSKRPGGQKLFKRSTFLLTGLLGLLALTPTWGYQKEGPVKQPGQINGGIMMEAGGPDLLFQLMFSSTLLCDSGLTLPFQFSGQWGVGREPELPSGNSKFTKQIIGGNYVLDFAGKRISGSGRRANGTLVFTIWQVARDNDGNIVLDKGGAPISERCSTNTVNKKGKIHPVRWVAKPGADLSSFDKLKDEIVMSFEYAEESSGVNSHTDQDFGPPDNCVGCSLKILEVVKPAKGSNVSIPFNAFCEDHVLARVLVSTGNLSEDARLVPGWLDADGGNIGGTFSPSGISPGTVEEVFEVSRCPKGATAQDFRVEMGKLNDGTPIRENGEVVSDTVNHPVTFQ